MSINAWGCMLWKVRARSGSRKFMLTAEGFMPVAPVWGRSEEERGVLGKQFPDPLE
jgi:hypothetical protein